ncbi:hypothetical protein LJC68_05385 [Bacteroidales bacterium OttesenSCG-928-B11]|nr:hypothetical protein [Bacteroidales bacterium OttesenSCG-928-E04]MDL2312290.1 hypothetical protein [Bacteroidales bacterium OttesenSCG-928-B11]MDL2326375.1 hypothetical protein [Bacteroidales bacterium OttesenSCG-928-A14]
MIGWLKNKFLSKYISEKKQRRVRAITSLAKAKTVGLLCHIESEAAYQNIFSIFTKLQQHNKNVRLVAFIKEKEVPFYCLQQLTADYFCLKDLNWYGKPNMVQVNDFIDIEFDILIDFTTEKNLLPVQLILQLSQARLITGANYNHEKLYDLFIDDKMTNNKALIDNIDLYTRKLIGETV